MINESIPLPTLSKTELTWYTSLCTNLYQFTAKELLTGICLKDALFLWYYLKIPNATSKVNSVRGRNSKNRNFNPDVWFIVSECCEHNTKWDIIKTGVSFNSRYCLIHQAAAAYWETRQPSVVGTHAGQ